MGFLDNLIRRETRRAIHSFVDSAVDNAVDKAKQSFAGAQNNNSANNQNNNNAGCQSGAYTNASTGSTPQTGYNTDTYCTGEADLRNRIEQIIRNEWPDYELVPNVSATAAMGANKDARDYTYGVYHNGVPIAMIMILNGNNESSRKAVRLAHEACFNRGVTCMNFMSYMANYQSYISARFQRYLRKGIQG